MLGPRTVAVSGRNQDAGRSKGKRLVLDASHGAHSFIRDRTTPESTHSGKGKLSGPKEYSIEVPGPLRIERIKLRHLRLFNVFPRHSVSSCTAVLARSLVLGSSPGENQVPFIPYRAMAQSQETPQPASKMSMVLKASWQEWQTLSGYHLVETGEAKAYLVAHLSFADEDYLWYVRNLSAPAACVLIVKLFVACCTLLHVVVALAQLPPNCPVPCETSGEYCCLPDDLQGRSLNSGEIVSL